MNYGLRLIITDQYWFVNANKRITPTRDVIIGKTGRGGGGRECMGTLHSAQVFCKSETLTNGRTVLGTQQVLNKCWLGARQVVGCWQRCQTCGLPIRPLSKCPSAPVQRQGAVCVLIEGQNSAVVLLERRCEDCPHGLFIPSGRC